MTIVCLAADFHDTPLPYLERFQGRANAVYSRLAEAPELIAGCVVVATCNRFEIYLDGKSVDTIVEAALPRLADALGEDAIEVRRTFRIMSGQHVTRHAFSVASGLESMVIGEDEISGQVTRALDYAQHSNTCTPRLYDLFRAAARVSKSVSHATGLGTSGRSIIAEALGIAESTGTTFDSAHAVVVGTGAYARIVTAALKRRAIGRISVISRSGRAESFAEVHGIESVGATAVHAVLETADVVIGASGIPGIAITADDVVQAFIRSERVTPMLFIDVALPTDIDPTIANLPHCTVITLETIRRQISPQHSESIESAIRIVTASVDEFEAHVRSRSIDPFIVALRQQIENAVESETDAVRRRRGDSEAETVRRSLMRVTNSWLHTPTHRAKEFAQHGNVGEYARALSALFDLEVEHDG
ncbi:glutamyl-tRNA reductase [Microbacteriaceae bacterium MWH-Ta3]|nr:glutamyl-tRNA reductase [Microbacteriaceae bacterium MWH-Ta3]